MWVYKSIIGPLIIKRMSNGLYGLFYNGELYNSSPSARAAADDVCCFATGLSKWDSLSGFIDYPSDLSEWVQYPDNW